MKVVVNCSGGLDSTTLLYHLRAEGNEVKALAVNYGQRHLTQETTAARSVCELLGVDLQIVDLTALVSFFGGNALTDRSVAVSEGPYSEESMKPTTVPNRNMILLALGVAWASSMEFEAAAFGAHAGEHTNYPDCQPAFAEAMDRAAQLCDWRPLRILAPFVTWNKAAVVRRGAELGVPFELTWSCYRGGQYHCGRCGTCIDRRTAFQQAGVPDPTKYAVPGPPG